MAMFGKVEDLIAQVHPASRLKRGLAILRDYREGRLSEFASVLAGLKAGEKTEIAIEDENLYAILQYYSPKPHDLGRFEAHQRYTDLQYLSEGTEWIYVCALNEQVKPPSFDAKGNVFFPLGMEARSRVRLTAGDVVVLFPNDAHAPCLRVEGVPDALVRKIVIKVKDAHLTNTSGNSPAPGG